MHGSNLISDLYLGLKSNPHKSLLSIGIISIGMLLLVLLVGILDSLEAKSNNRIKALGINVFAVSAKNNIDNTQGSELSIESYRTLRYALDNELIAPIKSYRASALGMDKSIHLVATSAQLHLIRGWKIDGGRFLSPLDIQTKSRVAVVDHKTYQQQGWELGNIVPVGRTTFKIVGVVRLPEELSAIQNNSKSSANSNVMFIPYSITPTWSNSEATNGILDRIFIKSTDITSFYSLIQKTRNLLHNPENKYNGLQWLTPANLVAEISALKRSLTLTLGGVSILSLVMGSITLITLMLSNVRERRIEIGLRRALGATQTNIQLQFVLEAVTITIVAALLGYLFAIMVVKLKILAITNDISIKQQVMLIPFFVSILIGSIAAYFPAKLAAEIDPAIALRSG